MWKSIKEKAAVWNPFILWTNFKTIKNEKCKIFHRCYSSDGVSLSIESLYHSSEIAVEMLLLVLRNSDSIDKNSSIKVGLFKLQCSSEWRELIVNTKETRDSKIYHDGQSFLTYHINNYRRMTKVVFFTINLELTFLFPS